MANDPARGEEGSALVEAALVLPVLLVLVLGLADVSLYVWQQNLAIKAVELGVRKAIVSMPVAVGPGLSAAESAGYWGSLPLGTRCSPDAGGLSPCPTFRVTCQSVSGCTCTGDQCGFSLARTRLEAIVAAMQAVDPQIKTDNVEVSYATNGLGYVGRPFPVGVDVTIRILGFRYDPGFLPDLLGSSLPIRAAATLPSEDLGSD